MDFLNEITKDYLPASYSNLQNVYSVKYSSKQELWKFEITMHDKKQFLST